MAPTNYGNCAGCRNAIRNREFLDCCICKMKYDIECANISVSRFHSFYALDQDRKKNWKCPLCYSKVRKTDNTNTPIQLRPTDSGAAKDDDDSISFRHSENITTRVKPKQQTQSPPCISESSSNDNYMTEDRFRVILKKELSEIMQHTIRSLVSEQLNHITGQFNELRESMTFFNKQYEEMKLNLESKTAIIEELQSDNQKLKSTLKNVSQSLNQVEQNMRVCNVEVSGIPENKSENLSNTFKQLAESVKASIVPDDILQVTRVAKLVKDSDRPRTVIAKLRTPRHRDIVLAAVAKFNKSNPEDKLSSKHLGYGGPRKPIFVAEHLSPDNKILHAAVRQRAREYRYKFTWVRNGRIFVRKEEFSEAILIRNLDNLILIK